MMLAFLSAPGRAGNKGNILVRHRFPPLPGIERAGSMGERGKQSTMSLKVIRSPGSLSSEGRGNAEDPLSTRLFSGSPCSLEKPRVWIETPQKVPRASRHERLRAWI